MTPDQDLIARLADPCPICGAVMEPYGDHVQHPVDDCVLAQMIVFDDAIDDWNRRPAVQAAVAKAVESEREECLKLADDQYGEGPNGSYDNGATIDGWNMATQAIASAIRSRGVAG